MKLTSVLSLMVLAVQAVPTPEEAIDLDIDAAKAFAESFTGTFEAPPGVEVPASIEARAVRSCYFDCLTRQGFFCIGMCSGGSLRSKMSCVSDCQQAGQPGCVKVCHK
ncbi:hypothetical protein ACHAPT_011987 [Fusarium lateritium]